MAHWSSVARSHRQIKDVLLARGALATASFPEVNQSDIGRSITAKRNFSQKKRY